MTLALARRGLRPQVLRRMSPQDGWADLFRALLGPITPPQPQFLTLKEAAEYTGLSVAFLRRLVRAEILPHIRDRRIKVRRSDLDNLSLADMRLCQPKLKMAGARSRKSRG